jgi:hypothetical protein
VIDLGYSVAGIAGIAGVAGLLLILLILLSIHLFWKKFKTCQDLKKEEQVTEQLFISNLLWYGRAHVTRGGGGC